MEDGADGVELDVRLSADNVPVVCHDPELTRITGGRDTRTIARIGSIELGRIELEQGARIPTLAEVLRWSVKTGALLDIELKQDGGRSMQLARVVRDTCRSEYSPSAPRLVLSSFNFGTLLALLSLGPPGELALLTEGPVAVPRFLELFTLLPISGLFPEKSLLTASQIDRLHRRGCFSGTWTVNSDVDITRARDLGTDVLIGDDPANLRKLVG
jgi:glycerophosphoryl diester phosphodiesterase